MVSFYSASALSRKLFRAFQQLGHIGADSHHTSKPVYLDVSVTEKKTSGSEMRNSEEYVATNSDEKVETCALRRSLLLLLLMVSCLASWLLFFIQANKLVKRFRKRQQKKLKKAAKKGNELKVPLLGPEGAMK